MINLPIKIMDIRAAEPMVMISKNTASKLTLRHTDVVHLKSDLAELVAYPVVATDIIDDDIIGISERDANWLKVNNDSIITITNRKTPISYNYIKKKIEGHDWTLGEINEIVKDISHRRLTNYEISTFALVSQFEGFNTEELVAMTRSMAEAGTQFKFDEPTYDKHSNGGIPGNKVTPIIVSIVAAAGLLIPKTSSRAITSPAGTADTMEVLADVKFTPEEIYEMVPKTRGMVVWNSPLNLSPLDHIVVDVKKELGIDPRDQMLASIVSTKLAMNVDNLIFDIPTGVGTKMPSRKYAVNFAHSLIDLCHQLDIRVEAAITLGDQPLGKNIGPALEAKEALEILENKKMDSRSVVEKSVELAGALLEQAGMSQLGQGSKLAHEYIKNGKALAKFKEIIEAQSGDPKITSDNIPVGEHTHIIKARKDGFIASVSNKDIAAIANAAGTPKHKTAGLVLHQKKGAFVHEGDPLFTIYSPSSTKLSSAIQQATTKPAYNIESMVIRRIGSVTESNIQEFQE